MLFEGQLYLSTGLYLPSRFTDEGTEAERGLVSYPGSHVQDEFGLGTDPERLSAVLPGVGPPHPKPDSRSTLQ